MNLKVKHARSPHANETICTASVEIANPVYGKREIKLQTEGYTRDSAALRRLAHVLSDALDEVRAAIDEADARDLPALRAAHAAAMVGAA